MGIGRDLPAGFDQDPDAPRRPHPPKDILFVSPTPAVSTGRASVSSRRCTGNAAEGGRYRRPSPDRQVMAPVDHLEAQLISMDKLRGLSDQVGAESCRRFVSNFVAMWDSRFTRLQQAVQRPDFDAAMDVVLSIKISSHMAGAVRLSALAAAAQELVVRRDASGLAEMVAAVDACGVETMAYLSDPGLLSPA